ncbi:MAG: hypothetical protein PHS96_05920 [Anaerolineales bacterium]|nr:hypothetical protein [Anaerolineales bacterium]
MIPSSLANVIDSLMIHCLFRCVLRQSARRAPPIPMPQAPRLLNSSKSDKSRRFICPFALSLAVAELPGGRLGGPALPVTALASAPAGDHSSKSKEGGSYGSKDFY